MAARLAIGAGAVLLAVALAIGVVLLTRDGDSPDIVLASAIDEQSGAPQDELDRVPAGTTELYAALPVDDVPAGERFRFVWSGGGDAVETSHEVVAAIDQGWAYSRLEAPNGLSAGDGYAVEVFRGDDRIARRHFEVIE